MIVQGRQRRRDVEDLVIPHQSDPIFGETAKPHDWSSISARQAHTISTSATIDLINRQCRWRGSERP
jgi:hypothetical protein